MIPLGDVGLALGALAAIAVLAGAGELAAEQVEIGDPVHQELAHDPRNIAVDLRAHLRQHFDWSTLVVDIAGFNGPVDRLDVTRCLFQAAHALSRRRFDKVLLADRGKPVLMMTGDYFQTLGEQYARGDPAALIPTLPQHVYDLSGTPVFPHRRGGFATELDEFDEFHTDWYGAPRSH